MIRLLHPIFLTLIGVGLLFSCVASAQVEQAVFDLDSLRTFDGLEIQQIRIHGLRWTKEQAVRWLLSQHEGDTFQASTWVRGLHKLYDTRVLYEIRTDIHVIEISPDGRTAKKIAIDVEISDRWTLLPYGIAQAGGGSNNLGGGIVENNFLGYFSEISGGYSEFDGVGGYDFNYYQEFFRDTDYIIGLDASQIGSPVQLQKNDGSSLGSFIWDRHQDQLLVGRRLPGNVRIYSYFEYFHDEMIRNDQAPEAMVLSVNQYRIRPILIVGRSELTNFLEQGFEFVFAPTSANFFNGPNQYSQIVMSFKRVFIERNTNYGFFIGGGAMTRAQIPYLFHLGGFDTVRGFSTNRALGRYYVNNSVEYRPYLARYYSWLTGEVIFQGDVFQDFGAMWNSQDLSETRRVNSEMTLLSQGAGIRLDFLRFAGAIVRLDAARTLIPNEGWGGSFSVGQFF